jgi:tellurite resistance protein
MIFAVLFYLKKMKLAQAGYHMLMILSIIDGEYKIEEGKVIVEYLHKSYNTQLNLDDENKALLNIAKDQLATHFKNAAQTFKVLSTPDQRQDFLTFAHRLIQADGNFANEENKVLSSLANSWKIDIEPLLDSNNN